MFALIFTAGITVLCGYFFWRFFVAFPGLGRWRWGMAGVLLAIATGRFVGRGLNRIGWAGGADALRLAMMMALVLLFWFLTLGLVLHLYNGAAWLAGLKWSGARRAVLSPKVGFLVSVALIACATVWAWFEAQAIRVRHVVIEVDRLPPGHDALRIALIADLHVGSPRSRQRLGAAVRLLEDLKPGMILSAGDMVDGSFEEVGHLADRFAHLDPPLGKYAILGNHDFYAGLDDAMAFHRAAGFIVLRQASAMPLPGLRITGVDDPAAHRRGHGNKISELPALKAASAEELVILLKHRPTIEPKALEKVDIQLSGHVHGGQVFPFGLFTWAAFGYRPGLYRLPENTALYITRGTGTWGPPLRLASPPEVTLIELRRPASS